MGTEEQEWMPKFDYHLDESDPDVLVLRRQDGTFVAAFSAQGATREGILEAASEDYLRLVSHLRAGAERAAFLDELPEHAAIVERSGTIVAVNRAWKRFAKDNGAEPGKVSEGANYLGVCDGAAGEQSEYARSFAEGLRAVLSNEEERFALEYPCHSPTERRWFVGSVGRLADGDAPLALVSHENVTGRKVRH
jgi:two-component system, NtrC family, sensor kinase